ncbi:hypothetical protein M427DRAFT_63002 [Gonapodya prolifera JEL478]|uniref:RING-type domain-containing protein n=1 Tax=Gonapodya prolifera (strain JEL478) TaxID=1344416 RepID=A0A139A135_GONPJ|nr:hypothetical protein M427DRAFT_63002 [Gonapodya prolifera JEL478]|eukprot:KXS10063.1 hypothetical protein M427DRAFT_63002 [Gonapodya prolifera JEL478]
MEFVGAARAQYPFEPENPEEVRLGPGDVVLILDKGIENSGWWKVKVVFRKTIVAPDSGNGFGLAPKTYLKEFGLPVSLAVALFQYSSVAPEELSFSVGDRFNIMYKPSKDPHWWIGVENRPGVSSRWGLLPASYLKEQLLPVPSNSLPAASPTLPTRSPTLRRTPHIPVRHDSKVHSSGGAGQPLDPLRPSSLNAGGTYDRNGHYGTRRADVGLTPNGPVGPLGTSLYPSIEDLINSAPDPLYDVVGPNAALGASQMATSTASTPTSPAMQPSPVIPGLQYPPNSSMPGDEPPPVPPKSDTLNALGPQQLDGSAPGPSRVPSPVINLTIAPTEDPVNNTPSLVPNATPGTFPQPHVPNTAPMYPLPAVPHTIQNGPFPIRAWQDRTRTHVVPGTFVKVAPSNTSNPYSPPNVHIMMQTGTEVAVLLDSLCEEDQEYVRTIHIRPVNFPITSPIGTMVPAPDHIHSLTIGQHTIERPRTFPLPQPLPRPLGASSPNLGPTTTPPPPPSDRPGSSQAGSLSITRPESQTQNTQPASTSSSARPDPRSDAIEQVVRIGYPREEVLSAVEGLESGVGEGSQWGEGRLTVRGLIEAIMSPRSAPPTNPPSPSQASADSATDSNLAQSRQNLDAVIAEVAVITDQLPSKVRIEAEKLAPNGSVALSVEVLLEAVEREIEQERERERGRELERQREREMERERERERELEREREAAAAAAAAAALVPPPPPDEQAKECIVCFDQPKEAVLVPCGHIGMCMACAEQLKRQGKRCPICRQNIERVIKAWIT